MTVAPRESPAPLPLNPLGNRISPLQCDRIITGTKKISLTQPSLLNQTGYDRTVSLVSHRIPNGNNHTVPWLPLLITIGFDQLQTLTGGGLLGAKEHQSTGGWMKHRRTPGNSLQGA